MRCRSAMVGDRVSRSFCTQMRGVDKNGVREQAHKELWQIRHGLAWPVASEHVIRARLRKPEGVADAARGPRCASPRSAPGCWAWSRVPCGRQRCRAQPWPWTASPPHTCTPHSGQPEQVNQAGRLAAGQATGQRRERAKIAAALAAAHGFSDCSSMLVSWAGLRFQKQATPKSKKQTSPATSPVLVT